MADPALLAEAYKRGLLPPDKKAAYEEASRRGLVASSQDAPTDPKWGIPVVGDFARSFGQAKDALVSDYQKQVAKATAPPPKSAGDFVSGAVDDLLRTPRMLMTAAGAIPGAAQAAVVRPVARAATIIPGTNAADNEQIINTALMGLRPAPGRLPVPGSVEPPPVPFPKPELRAATALHRAMTRDAVVPADVVAATKAAPERLPFELGGENLKSVAEAAAQVPGPSRRILSEKMTGRGPQDMRERVIGKLQPVLGVEPEAIAGDFAGQAAKLRANAAPLYDEAYAAGPIDSPKLQTLVNRPSMRGAMARAARIAAEEGRDPNEIGFRVVQRAGEPTTVQRPTMQPSPAGGMMETWKSESAPGSLENLHVQVDNPTAQTWDYVKRGLDDVLETYRDKTTRRLALDEHGRAILGTLNDLRGELINQNPAYGRALAAGGEPLQLEEAYRDAPKLMNNGVNERLFSERWFKATPGQQDAMKGGWANDLFEQARGGRLNLKSLQSPAYRSKVTTMFGDDAARVLHDVVTESLQMQANHQQMFGNSRTAGRAAAIQDLGANGGTDPLDVVASTLDTGLNPVRLSGKALKAALKAVPRKDRSVIGDPVANEALGKALTDPDEMTRLLNLLEAHKARPLLPTAPRAGSLTSGVLPPPPKPARR